MIHDATVEVSCDDPHCDESIIIGLPFTYPNLSGRGESYDHRLTAIRKKIEAEEWVVVGEEGEEKTYCGAHAAVLGEIE